MAISDEEMKKVHDAAFRMPSVQTMVGRKSTITNAFVGSVIPVIMPTTQEIGEALRILAMKPEDVRCAYCGDISTEWDHLRPLVKNRRPTGYVSEIANLVPACGKCNQSKGNKPWREWMIGKAGRSPMGRGLLDIEIRMGRLEEYERWKPATKVDFETIIGNPDWEAYWQLCEAVNNEMREAQLVAESIRLRVLEGIKAQKAQ